mgnify:CR=1 FL=1
MKLIQVNEETYNAFLKTRDYVNFLQSTEQSDKMKSNGWTIDYVQFEEENRTVAGAFLATMPLMKVFRYCYIPRGILMIVRK